MVVYLLDLSAYFSVSVHGLFFYSIKFEIFGTLYGSVFVVQFLEHCSFDLLMHRFGYDYPSGYDREMGGRSGYGDERPHGRYVGRPSGGYGPGGKCLNVFQRLFMGWCGYVSVLIII